VLIRAESETFRLAEAFTISRGTKTEAEVVTARLGASAGECVPYARYGETVESVIAEINALPEGLDRLALQEAMKPGAARNAVDCAFWDAEARASGARAWEVAGLARPGPEITAYTLSLGEPDVMEAAAAKAAIRPLLKVKLGTEDDMARIEAVRRGAPQSRIIVDANEGWSAEVYSDLAPHFVRLGVEMVEQPLPAGDDDALLGLERPLPVCADESVHDRGSLESLKGKYDMVNIKLDKTGGLTEALALKAAAEDAGFKIMVGCMVGTSLGMAPAVLVAQGAAVVDLDGPLLLAEDRAHPLLYNDQGVHPSEPGLWG